MLQKSLSSRLFRINRVSKRFFFIETETTPNPLSLKFLVERDILPKDYNSGLHFDLNSPHAFTRSPFIKSLFGIEGVKGVFLGKNFITITKASDDSWSKIKPQVFTEIMNYLSNEAPLELEIPDLNDTKILDSDDEIVSTIKELMETRIRPSVQEDGGDIFFEGFDHDTGMVKVRLAGSCVGCPSSTVTLRNGVENMLTHYIPEVTGILDVSGVEDPDEELKLQFKTEFDPNDYK